MSREKIARSDNYTVKKRVSSNENVVIANPIYDAVFKRLLENNKIAKFLIGTILDCKIVSLKAEPVEHSKIDEVSGAQTLYRKDFTAAIKLKTGETKTVIIEMQKAKNLNDIDRFRDYLGGEYTKSKHPIIAIYILGFNLTVSSPAFVAYPECFDIQTNKKINDKDRFVEHLTHKAYFVQTKKIKQNLNTKLDALLSIFAQDNFASQDKTTKSFPTEQSIPEIKEMITVLQHAAADKELRKELDKELYYQRYVEQTFGEANRKIEELTEKLADKDVAIADKDAAIADKDAENKQLRLQIAQLQAKFKK